MSPILRLLATVLAAAPITATAAPQRDGETAEKAKVERPGKPTGPIAVDHRLGAALAVGASVVVTITARVEPTAGELAIEATATRPAAVLLTTPVRVASGPGMSSWQLTVVPLAVDAGYLNVIVTGEIDGLVQARTVSLALRSAEPAAALEARGDSETLIALPVRESP